MIRNASDGGKICCFVAFIIVIILILLVGGAFNIVGLVYSILSLKDITSSRAYTCMICVIVAYGLGVFITFILSLTVFCKNESCKTGCACFNFVMQSLGGAYMFAIFIYSQVVYWGSEKGTFCNGGPCSFPFVIGMLGYIIAYYATIGLYILLIVVCSGLGISMTKG